MATLAGIFAAFAYAVNDMFYRELSPKLILWLLMFSTNLGLLVVSAISLVARRERLFPKNWGYPLAWSALKIINVFSAISAFRLLPISQVYLMIFTYPILVVILRAITKRRFKRHYAVSIICGAVGLSFVFGLGHLEWNMGAIMALMVSLCVAVQIMIARRMKDECSQRITFLSGVMGVSVAAIGLLSAILTTPHAGSIASRLWNVDPIKWILPLLGLVIASVSANVTQVYAAQKLPSTRYALLCYLQIPIAVLMAFIFLHEPIHMKVAVGLILISAGSIVAQLQNAQETAQTHPPLNTEGLVESKS